LKYKYRLRHLLRHKHRKDGPVCAYKPGKKPTEESLKNAGLKTG